MNDKWNNVYVFLIVLCLFIDCSKNEKKDAKETIQNNEDIEIIIRPNIKDFYFEELMDGNKKLDFHVDEYKVIELFGEPLEIIIELVSFYFEGGIVVELQKYVYDDFTHYYYVFENGEICYNGFMVENKLERLKTINIGDTSDKLLSTFSDEYYTKEKYETIKENISYYPLEANSAVCEIQFVIRDKIIQKIFVNFILI